MNKLTLDQRIDKYIEKIDDCFMWVGAFAGENSPVIYFQKKNLAVKHYLFEKKYGIPSLRGYLINNCPNKKCVNPDHLKGRDEIFNSLIDKNDENGCWNWLGQKKGGYGFFYINGKDRLVHRYMFEKYNHQIINKGNVCHNCDNPSCVNPDHLWLGSHTDNMRDMISKKRGGKAFGERHPNCKIDEKTAIKIKALLRSGMKMTEIRDRLNVTYKVIQHIKNGTSWKHIPF